MNERAEDTARGTGIGAAWQRSGAPAVHGMTALQGHEGRPSLRKTRVTHYQAQSLCVGAVNGNIVARFCCQTEFWILGRWKKLNGVMLRASRLSVEGARGIECPVRISLRPVERGTMMASGREQRVSRLRPSTGKAGRWPAGRALVELSAEPSLTSRDLAAKARNSSLSRRVITPWLWSSVARPRWSLGSRCSKTFPGDRGAAVAPGPARGARSAAALPLIVLTGGAAAAAREDRSGSRDEQVQYASAHNRLPCGPDEFPDGGDVITPGAREGAEEVAFPDAGGARRRRSRLRERR